MFGKVYTFALLVVVMVTAVTRVEDTTEYSPWCSCRVPAQLTVLLPRSTPCKRLRHRRFENQRLYLVLLLLLAGDVELNPGPTHAKNSLVNNATPQSTDELTHTSKDADRCSLCDNIVDNLALRSRDIADAIVKCAVSGCGSFAHNRCRQGETKNQETDWTCDGHTKTSGDHQSEQERHPNHAPNGDDATAHILQTEPVKLTSTRNKTDTGSDNSHQRKQPCINRPPSAGLMDPEPIPGPSFASVNLMDLMEALRLTQLKVDKISKDLTELKLAIQLLSAGDSGPRPPTTNEDSASQVAQPGQGGQRRDTQKRCSSGRDNHPDLLIIGDSNVRRLGQSNVPPNVSCRSISGATVHDVERELAGMSDDYQTSGLIIHAGTNDLARKGSEEIVSSLMKLAQNVKGRSRVRQVYICSVTPRKDLGAFVFSRSESVNNRLRSLCMETHGISFIDLREQLDRCQFSGLVRDGLHYNKAGASRTLNKILDSVDTFLD